MKSLPECSTDSTESSDRYQRWFSGPTSQLSRGAPRLLRRRLQLMLDRVCANARCLAEHSLGEASHVRYEVVERRFRHHAKNARAPRCDNNSRPKPPTTPIRMIQLPPAGASIGENLMPRL